MGVREGPQLEAPARMQMPIHLVFIDVYMSHTQRRPYHYIYERPSDGMSSRLL